MIVVSSDVVLYYLQYISSITISVYYLLYTCPHIVFFSFPYTAHCVFATYKYCISRLRLNKTFFRVFVQIHNLYLKTSQILFSCPISLPSCSQILFSIRWMCFFFRYSFQSSDWFFVFPNMVSNTVNCIFLLKCWFNPMSFPILFPLPFMCFPFSIIVFKDIHVFSPSHTVYCIYVSILWLFFLPSSQFLFSIHWLFLHLLFSTLGELGIFLIIVLNIMYEFCFLKYCFQWCEYVFLIPKVVFLTHGHLLPYMVYSYHKPDIIYFIIIVPLPPPPPLPSPLPLNQISNISGGVNC